MDSRLHWLMAWYLRHCDGDWEHAYGVKIDTMDNPGWMLQIALRDTPLYGRDFVPNEHGTPANDLSEWQSSGSWWVAKVNGEYFQAFCGPLDLEAVINIFRRWVEALELPQSEVAL